MLAGAAAKGKRAWFVVHRRELVNQAVETFVTAADLHTGIIAAGYPPDAAAPVQVCSVGSLKRRLSAVKPPDLLIIDECHHLPSASWSAIVQALPNAVQIGLTATPSRLDGRGLRPFFDALLCGPSTADLIAQGWLAPYKLFAPSTTDLTRVHTVAGDYNRKEVSETMRASTVVGDAVGTYLRHATDGRALVFAWSLEASQALADAFTMAGVPAAHVDGETAPAARLASLRAFRDGSLRVLCNVDLFGEGLDVPSVDAVFLLRPTQSLGLYLQQCGRGLRPAAGKTAVSIFDHVGNYARHGLPDDPRVWTLDGVAKGARKALPALKRCAQCFAVAGAAALKCPYCGAPYLVKARKVVRVDGELGEVDLQALRGQVRELQRDCHTLAEWQVLARRLGYKPGWAWMAFNRSRRHRRVSA